MPGILAPAPRGVTGGDIAVIGVKDDIETTSFMPFKALPNLEIAPTGEDSTKEPRFLIFAYYQELHLEILQDA